MKRAIQRRLRLIKLMLVDTKKCIFCTATGTTREHIFPRWSHQFFLPKSNRKARVRISVIRENRTDILDDLKMTGPIQDWQIQCVCAPCNNVWMKNIEKAAQPIMEFLCKGERVRLSEADQKIIATWAILKVMVVHHHFVHHLQRKQMMVKREPPRRWSVWIATYERRNWLPQFLTTPMGLDPPNSPQRSGRRGGAPNSHATTQIIKKLFIHVVNVPMDGFATRWWWTDPAGAPFKGDQLQIWPPSVQSYLWPRKALDDVEAETIANAVFRGFLRAAAAS